MTNNELEISNEICIIDPKLHKNVETLRVIMLSGCSQTVFPELLDIFGIEHVIRFMDIFGGLVVKVPHRSFLEQAVRDIHIYNMMTESTDTLLTNDYLAKKYEMKPEYVQECFLRIKKLRAKYGLRT